MYVGENVEGVLRRYDASLAKNLAEQEFVEKYPRPIDYILYGIDQDGEAVGLALKLEYHCTWWVGKAECFRNVQTRARVYFILAKKKYL